MKVWFYLRKYFDSSVMYAVSLLKNMMHEFILNLYQKLKEIPVSYFLVPVEIWSVVKRLLKKLHVLHKELWLGDVELYFAW